MMMGFRDDGRSMLGRQVERVVGVPQIVLVQPEIGPADLGADQRLLIGGSFVRVVTTRYRAGTVPVRYRDPVNRRPVRPAWW